MSPKGEAMAKAKGYYDILGVARSATDKDIRAAYRRLARKYHPDVNPGSKEALEKFKEVNAAYEVLGDAEKRKKYNRYGENWKHADQFAGAGTGPTGDAFFWRSTGGGPSVDLGDLGFGSLFTDLLSGSRSGSRARTTVRSTPVDVPVELTLEEAYAGVTQIVQTPALPGTPSKRLEVKVPAGVDNGARIHVPAGREMDVYLVVTVRPHHHFLRKSADLYVELHLLLVDAVLGSDREVPTLKGKAMLTVPPETQNGQVFRLRGQGMPRLGQKGKYGDLFATAKVVLPANLSEQEKELFRELKQARAAG